MSVIKQISVFNGSDWTTGDIGANASNIDITSGILGSSANVQSALTTIGTKIGTTAIPSALGTTITGAINTLGQNPVKLLETPLSSADPISYSCNWSQYRFLYITFGYYNNIYDSKFISVDYFSSTTNQTKVYLYSISESTRQLYNSASLYKNNNNSVYIISNNPTILNFYIRIYGIK